jgi:hypothetical protein
LEQFGQDQNTRIRIVAEVGQVLKRVADAVKRARQADWSAKPSAGALTWINQPRSMKYFITVSLNFRWEFTLAGKLSELLLGYSQLSILRKPCKNLVLRNFFGPKVKKTFKIALDFT